MWWSCRTLKISLGLPTFLLALASNNAFITNYIYSIFSSSVRVNGMIIEDEGAMELGSDHNLIWCVTWPSEAGRLGAPLFP